MRTCNCNWCDDCAGHYPAPQPIDRTRYAMTDTAKHDYSGTLELFAVASNRRQFRDAVAGTGRDGMQYVRLYDTFYSPPVPVQTIKHGNAYGAVMSMPYGQEAQGIG